MKTMKPYAEVITPIDGDAILKHIELCGRVCYKSEDKITSDSAKKFISGIIKRGHESVLEHYSLTVRFVCDRGVSHEIVRHRIASYSQESTRYCNYGNDDGGCTFIEPCFWDGYEPPISPMPKAEQLMRWKHAMQRAECTYRSMINVGASPQEARSVLPNSLKTEVIMTANLREWRHFFRLRTAKAAHPQMREVAIPLLRQLQDKIPVVFTDIEVN